MRCLKWISMLIVIALLCAMLPATVAEEKVIIDLDESVDGGLELELDGNGDGNGLELQDGVDLLDPSAVSMEDTALELDGLAVNLTNAEVREQTNAFAVSNASGDFEIDENGTLTRYGGFDKNVVIPDEVKAIGSDAFRGYTAMESVTIPTSVTSIGGFAFDGCTGLKSVAIPNSVVWIDWFAFDGCTGLTSVSLSDGLEYLGDGAFSDCTSLTSITIPDSVTSMYPGVFSGCSSLTSIRLPANMTELSNSLFSDCDSLESLDFLSGVTKISGSVFSGCDGLKSITIPASVTYIGSGVFGYCKNLECVTMHAGVTFIDRTAFDGSDNVVIRGTAGSYAETYANGMSIPFNAPVVTFDEQLYELWDSDWYYALILYINQSHDLKTIQKPTDLARTLSWSSSNPSVTTVDQSGKVTGIAQGQATITAATADGKGKAAQIRIVVPEPTKVELSYHWGDDKDIVLNKTSTISASREIPYQYETKVEMPITWSTSDKSVISIESSNDSEATLKGNKLGTATITASSPDGGSASVEIEVIRPEPEGIKIDQSGPIRLYPGDKYALSTTLMPAEARSKLTWYSDDKRVASVNRKGVITAVATGWTYISVETENGYEDSIEIEVLIPPKKVKLSKTKATLGAKEMLALKATLTPTSAETSLAWSSDNIKVATVNSKGLVTAKKPGTAVITVKTRNGKTAKATITVKKAPNKVTLDKSGTVALAKGKKLKLKATLPDGTASALTWSSSKPKVASVDQKGVVTAKKPGTAVITVRTFNGKAASVTIRVK